MLTTAAAHDGDVNVINWSRREPFLLSGGDDGALKVWDLRQFKVRSQLGAWRSSCSHSRWDWWVRPLTWSSTPELGVPFHWAQPLRATEEGAGTAGGWLGADVEAPFYQPES